MLAVASASGPGNQRPHFRSGTSEVHQGTVSTVNGTLSTWNGGDHPEPRSVASSIQEGAVRWTCTETSPSRRSLTSLTNNNLTTPARTYNYTYLTDPNYLSRYIRNRLAQVTLTAGGTNTTLVTNTYVAPATAAQWPT